MDISALLAINSASTRPRIAAASSLRRARRSTAACSPRCAAHAPADVDATVARAQQRSCAGAMMPAPKRGELVRVFGDELRAHKAVLGASW